MRYGIFIGWVLCWALALGGCEKEAQQHAQDIADIEAYVQANNLPAERDSDADYFYYFPVSNDAPELIKADRGLTVEVRYRAELLDGTEVATTGTDFEQVPLDESLYGWRLALPRMAIGEQMVLILPSRLAYADEASPTIPPHSNLIFYIELLEVYPQF